MCLHSETAVSNNSNGISHFHGRSTLSVLRVSSTSCGFIGTTSKYNPSPFTHLRCHRRRTAAVRVTNLALTSQPRYRLHRCWGCTNFCMDKWVHVRWEAPGRLAIPNPGLPPLQHPWQSRMWLWTSSLTRGNRILSWGITLCYSAVAVGKSIDMPQINGFTTAGYD